MNTSNPFRCLFSGALTVLLLSACAGKPLVPYSTDTEPLVLLPANQAGAVGGSLGDGRAYRPFARIYGFDRN